jgi:uncharacterized membrane protein
MGRRTLLLLVLVAVIIVIISAAATFLPHQTMMSRMMGQRYLGMGNFLWPAILTASATVVVVIIAYVIAYPNIRYVETGQKTERVPASKRTDLDAMDVVMRVAKPDERTALEVLKNSGGVCLQKDITYKTGLSKLKTHRIIARLAERGIVQVRKVGKTNEITVPAWLKPTGQPNSTETA